MRSILHSVASAANFKHGHISVLQSSQWDGCIPSMARIPSRCHSSCSNLCTRTEPSTNRRQPELCCGSLGTTSPAVPTSHLMCCSWIPVVSCFVSLPLLSASFLCLMWWAAEAPGAQGQCCEVSSTVWGWDDVMSDTVLELSPSYGEKLCWSPFVCCQECEGWSR